jgi:hypothetical protein
MRTEFFIKDKIGFLKDKKETWEAGREIFKKDILQLFFIPSKSELSKSFERTVVPEKLLNFERKKTITEAD